MFFILQSFLFVSCTYLGFLLSKKDKNIYFLMMVIIYTLIEGLRFGRGIDYNVYVYVYDNVERFGEYSSSESFIFNALCLLLTKLGMPYQALIMVCSFILAFCGFTFLRRYRECLVFSVPLFIMLSLSAENLFRWYTGFSFILMALLSYLDGRKKWFFVFLFIACGIHPALLLIVPVFWYCLHRGDKILLSPWLAFAIYIVFSAVWDNSIMLRFTKVLPFLLGNSEHYSSYSDNAEMWLTSSNRDEYKIGFITIIRLIISFPFYLFVGKKLVEIKPKLTPYYNMLVLGIVSYPVVHIELANRYNQLLVFFECVIGAYCYLYVIRQKIKTHMVVAILSILLVCGHIVRIIRKTTMGSKWETMYIWEADGLRTVPVKYWEK